MGTLPSRILRLAESGASGAILSQNMMIEALVDTPPAATAG